MLSRVRLTNVPRCQKGTLFTTQYDVFYTSALQTQPGVFPGEPADAAPLPPVTCFAVPDGPFPDSPAFVLSADLPSLFVILILTKTYCYCCSCLFCPRPQRDDGGDGPDLGNNNMVARPETRETCALGSARCHACFTQHGQNSAGLAGLFVLSKKSIDSSSN